MLPHSQRNACESTLATPSRASSARSWTLTSRKRISFSPIRRARLSIAAPRVGLERHLPRGPALLDDEIRLVLQDDLGDFVRMPRRDHERRGVGADRLVLVDVEPHDLTARRVVALAEERRLAVDLRQLVANQLDFLVGVAEIASFCALRSMLVATRSAFRLHSRGNLLPQWRRGRGR